MSSYGKVSDRRSGQRAALGLETDRLHKGPYDFVQAAKDQEERAMKRRCPSRPPDGQAGRVSAR